MTEELHTGARENLVLYMKRGLYQDSQSLVSFIAKLCNFVCCVASYSVFFFYFETFSIAEIWQKNQEGNYCGESNATSNGDVKYIAVIQFCVSRDKIHTQMHKMIKEACHLKCRRSLVF